MKKQPSRNKTVKAWAFHTCGKIDTLYSDKNCPFTIYRDSKELRRMAEENPEHVMAVTISYPSNTK